MKPTRIKVAEIEKHAPALTPNGTTIRAIPSKYVAETCGFLAVGSYHTLHTALGNLMAHYTLDGALVLIF